MVFPSTPEDTRYELFLSTLGWTDVTSDVYNRDGVGITRGYTSEKTDGPATPQKCSLTLDNRTGKYTPSNPLGQYFRQFGVNTALRVSTGLIADTFGRTVSNGWGTADTGEAWTVNGTAADFSVGSGTGKHTISAANTIRFSYLPGLVFRDVDVTVTVATNVTAVAGGSIFPGCIILSGQSTTDYFLVAVEAQTTSAVRMRILHSTGVVISNGYVTKAGLTYTGQTLKVRAQMEGQTIRAKLWVSGQPEPYAWDIDGSTALDAYINRPAGWVGIYSLVAAGNTNTPVVFSYDGLDVRIPRFHGEVSAWPSEWDVSGEDVYVPVVASGLRRRLSQGDEPVLSPFARANAAYSPAHILYFPFEDPSGSTVIASGLPNQDPMTITGRGTATFASSTAFAGSAAICKPNGARFTSGRVNVPRTGKLQLLFLLDVPNTGEADLAAVAQVQCVFGGFGYIDVRMRASGSLRLDFSLQDRSLFTSTADITTNANGRPLQVSVELTESGGNINWTVAWIEPGAGSGTSTSGTVIGFTFGAPAAVLVDPYTESTAASIGHVAVRTDIISIFALGEALAGYPGEYAVARMERLADENDGIPMTSYQGAIPVSTQVGTQKVKSLLELWDETVKADLGYLNECRGTVGLVHRWGTSLYNLPVALQLDYATGQVQPPFGQVDDDQLLLNDFTAKRTDGSSYRATQTSGPMAVTSPTSGFGVGRYPDSLEYNVYADTQLPDIAWWKVNLGTVVGPRYPRVTVNLAKLALVSKQLYVNALSVDLQDRIEIVNPKSLVINGTISQIVPGYTETLASMRHEIEFVCVPGTPFEVAEVSQETGDTNPWLARGDTDGTYITPILLGVGTAGDGNNASVVPGLPAGFVAGDTLIMVAAIRNSGAGVPNTPAGWTLLADASNVKVFGKTAGAGEVAPTVSFTGGVANATTQAQIAAFRGLSLNIINSATQLNGSAQNIAYPAVSVTGGYATVLVVGWKQDDWTSVATLSGFGEVAEVSSLTGDDAGIVWDYSIQGLTSADIASGSFTVTGGAAAISRGITVALSPGTVPAGITSLTVAIPTGPLWTTTADDYPMYLDVNGVQARATACTGSTLQTFTIDPLPAARPAGTSGPVSVWHLPVLAQ